MSDPTYVTPTQLRAAYDALGLDPELFTSTRTITLDPHEVVTVRYVRLDGNPFLHDGEPVTCSVGLPVADTDPNDMTTMLAESFADGQQLLAALADPDEPRSDHDCGDPDCHDCGTTA